MSERRYHCNECSFGTDVRVVMKDHAAVLGHFGWTDNEVKSLRVTRLDGDTGQPTGDPVVIKAAATLGFDVQFPETGDPAAIDYAEDVFKRLTVGLAMLDVDPDLLGILTGGVMGNPPPSTFTMDFNFPVKRTFWQWLRRKPKQWRRVHVPNVTVREED